MHWPVEGNLGQDGERELFVLPSRSRTNRIYPTPQIPRSLMQGGMERRWCGLFFAEQDWIAAASRNFDDNPRATPLEKALPRREFRVLSYLSHSPGYKNKSQERASSPARCTARSI